MEPPKLYEVRPSPNKGLGIFAATSIPRGTRLLAEEPLLSTKVPQYLESDLLPSFNLLNPEQQPLFWTLHSGHGQDSTKWPDMIHPGVAHSDTHRIREQHKARLADSKSILSVFMVNCMEMGDGAGLFLEAARFNHSCRPNACFSWNGDLRKETVHAIRDIEVGEEIFLCYIDPIGDTSLRRWNLQHYGFVCDCLVCNEDVSSLLVDPASEAETQAEEGNYSSPTTSAARRLRLTELEDLSSEPALMLYLMPDEDREIETQKRISYALETAALMNEEDLYLPSLAMVYFDIATQCEAQEDYPFAIRAAEKGLQVNIDCLGLDHPKTKAAQEILERLSQLNEAVEADTERDTLIAEELQHDDVKAHSVFALNETETPNAESESKLNVSDRTEESEKVANGAQTAQPRSTPQHVVLEETGVTA